MMYTKTVSYDLSPAMVEGEIRDKLIEMGWKPPEEYKITHVDFWEKDAILEIAGKNVYFQFDGEETPTLVDAIKYLVKEADAHYD